MTTAYYNDTDPEIAAWLRELIKRGLIAPGDVDERDIRDVVPAELVGYDQCHFFAGVGTWSLALRRAGWSDDRPVWTVSCPCQPFSQAGQGKGFTDERHLWPAWFHLASQCKPGTVFGEQVESNDGLAWLDLVWDDMEAVGYAFGPVVLPASGVGAPHGRHRIWFVADSTIERQFFRGSDEADDEPRTIERPEGLRLAGVMRDTDQSGLAGRSSKPGDDGEELTASQRTGGPVNGFWADAEWLPCSDGKARAAQPGIFPLAHGSSRKLVRGSHSNLAFDANATSEARTMRLRGYGNGIVVQAAEAVVKAYMEKDR